MHSPAQAILWQIYWRYRWGFVAAAAYLLVAIVLCRVMPHHWTIQFNNNPVPAVGWFFGVSCMFVNVMLITAFSMSGPDTKNYNFARHMFVLPVRTSALVAWPLITGCLTVAAFWLITASLVFRPTGIPAPLWWPAAALALYLATFQALAWTPFAQRWWHGALTAFVLMMPLLVLLPILIISEALELRLSALVAAGFLISLIPLAYLAAYSGVSRARRSEPYDLRIWNRFIEWLARWRPAASHPFRTLHRAQLWYECRAHLIVPVFIACLLPCILFLPAIDRHNVALGWRLLGMMLCAPLLVGMPAGSALGNLVDPLSKRESSAFVLVRPISSLSIIRGKLLLAAVMTATIWILFLGYISVLLSRPGFAQSIVSVLSSVPAWKAVGYPILTLSLLVLFTWKCMVESLWVALTGRKWVEQANAFFFVGLVFIGTGLALLLVFQPQWQTTALAAVPWLMGLLLAVKLAAAAFVVDGLVRCRLTTAGGAGVMIVTWLAVVGSLCGLALTLLPPKYAAPAHVIPGIALFIPFARLAGAPLALHSNRHR